jgi:hypothetical protein
VAEHNTESELAGTMGYMVHLIKEAIEKWLHPDNFKRCRIYAKLILEPGYQHASKKQSHKQSLISTEGRAVLNNIFFPG